MERVKSFIDDLISTLRFRNREIKTVTMVHKEESEKVASFHIIMEDVEDILVLKSRTSCSYQLIIRQDKKSILVCDNGGKVRELYEAAELYWKELISIRLFENGDKVALIKKDNLKDREEEMKEVIAIMKTIYREK